VDRLTLGSGKRADTFGLDGGHCLFQSGLIRRELIIPDSGPTKVVDHFQDPAILILPAVDQDLDGECVI
jgi:hypothetical protein